MNQQIKEWEIEYDDLKRFIGSLLHQTEQRVARAIFNKIDFGDFEDKNSLFEWIRKEYGPFSENA